MPLCTVCKKFLHPDFSIFVDNGIYKCVFCSTGKDYVTIEDTETKQEIQRVTKNEAIIAYKRYVDQLLQDRKIQGIIDSRIVKG